MKLWSQAMKLGEIAANSMTTTDPDDDITLQYNYDVFAHSFRIFNSKCVFFGLFNGQGLGQPEKDYDIKLKVVHDVDEKGNNIKYFIKAIVQNIGSENNRMMGAVLLGNTDLEDTFENLILNKIDISPLLHSWNEFVHDKIDI